MMFSSLLAYVGLALIMAVSMLLLIGQNTRVTILLMAVQYLAVFLLIFQVWPLGLAAVKMIAGWMGVAILAGTIFQKNRIYEMESGISSRLFRLLLGVLVWVLFFIIAPSFSRWLPIPNVFLWSGGILLGVGLLQLGTSQSPLRVIIGLLTVISGFEIFYAAVENSTLVTVLLAVVTLGLAVVGAYILNPTKTEETS
jgi:hypothetical protein